MERSRRSLLDSTRPLARDFADHRLSLLCLLVTGILNVYVDNPVQSSTSQVVVPPVNGTMKRQRQSAKQCGSAVTLTKNITWITYARAEV